MEAGGAGANHRRSENDQTTSPQRTLRENPTSRAKDARKMGHPDDPAYSKGRSLISWQFTNSDHRRVRAVLVWAHLAATHFP
jgi:hypothetical protein